MKENGATDNKASKDEELRLEIRSEARKVILNYLQSSLPTVDSEAKRAEFALEFLRFERKEEQIEEALKKSAESGEELEDILASI